MSSTEKNLTPQTTEYAMFKGINESKSSLPTFIVTPAMVKRMARQEHIHVTTQDALDWLRRHKRRIENDIYDGAAELVQEVLFEATIESWPNRVFNRMFQRIDKAVDEAIELYAETHHLKRVSSTLPGEDAIELTHRFLRHKGKTATAGCWDIEIGFIEASAKIVLPAKEVPYTVEIIYQGKKVTAELRTSAVSEKPHRCACPSTPASR